MKILIVIKAILFDCYVHVIIYAATTITLDAFYEFLNLKGDKYQIIVHTRLNMWSVRVLKICIFSFKNVFSRL